MTRLGIVFWLVLVLASGFTTFRVKYAVQDLEDELNRVRRQTIAEQQEIRVLNTEWTFLTQPERLAELNKRFLGLSTVSAKQLRRGIEDIPLRLVVVPPEPPESSADRAAAPPVQMAKAETPAPASLDALVAQIADTP